MKDGEKRASFFFQCILILALLCTYLATLLPGPGDHPDTAKFQFVGYILGTPHAPGYPAYMILTHFFAQLFPWGSLAYKINLLSALFSVATCWVLFRILLLLNVKPLIAFFSALIFGLSRTFWSQAIIAEVYALNALFVALVVYFFIRWNLEKRDRFLLIACGIYALSFGHHLTMVTFLPAIAVLVLMTDSKVFFRPKLVLPVVSFIVLAALQYYYPLWRFHDPSTIYLDMQTPTFRKLIYAVTGGHFKAQMFAFSFSEVLRKRIPMFFGLLWREYSFLLPLLLFGIYRFRNRTFQLFLLLSIAGNVLWCLNYNIPDIYVYFIPSYLLIAIYIAVGLNSTRLAVPLGSIAVILLFFTNYFIVDQSRNTAGEQAKAVLQASGLRAIVFGRGRELPRMYFFYYLYGEGLYRKQLYAAKFTRNFLLRYVFDHRPYRVRELRRNIPPGFALFCTTAEQRRTFENLGFVTKRAGPGVFRVIATDHIHRPGTQIRTEPEEEED